MSSSAAAKKITRSSASASTTRRRRRRTTAIADDGSGGSTHGDHGHPVRTTRSSAERKRRDADDDDDAGGIRSRSSGDSSGQRRRRKRQRRSSSSPTNDASATVPAKKRKGEKPQGNAEDDGNADGGLKVGTTITFGGGRDSDNNNNTQMINDENRSGNAHNLSLAVTVVRVLGSGAHGTVYLAEAKAEEEEGTSIKDKTRYVLKVPMATKDDLREARCEIRALEALKGVAGVVQLVASSNFGSSSSTACMLLKHVDGQVLEEYIEQRGRLSLREAWGLMKQLVATLVEMKEKAGLSHLDIKPDNCLVTTNDRRLILFDLGTARPCDRPTSDDLGSVFFDAPEIHRGDKKKTAARTPFDPLPADMYSVARTFLVALVGYHPCRPSSPTEAGGEEGDWWEEDTFGTIEEHIGSIRNRCPAAADLLGQLLQEDPTQRPTAEQALEALTNRPWE